MPAAGSRRTQGVGRGQPRRWLGALDHVILLAGVAVALSLAYLLFVVLSGGLADQIIARPQLEARQAGVAITLRVFAWAAWILVFAALGRRYRSEAVGYLTLAAGVISYVLLPLLVRSQVPPEAAPGLVELGQSLVAAFRTHGGLLVVVGALRVVLGRIVILSLPAQAGRRVRLAGESAPAPEEPQRASLLRACWELQFCRGSLRSGCPRYRERVSCWRRRSGCYCDRELAVDLLSALGGEQRLEVAEELQAAQTRTRTAAPRARTGRSRRKTRPPCGRCPIYLDHQRYKYRAASWAAYPAAVAVVALTAGYIRAGYHWVDATLTEALSHVQVLPDAFPDQTIQGFEWLSAENMVVVITGLLVVGVLLQLTEVAIFRLKW